MKNVLRSSRTLLGLRLACASILGAVAVAACASGDGASPEDLGHQTEPQLVTTVPSVSPTVIPFPPSLLRCVTVRRGATTGQVDDTWLAPGYPTVTFGDVESLDATGLITHGGEMNIRSLLRFDIGANAIPEGASITNAEVVLTPLDTNITGSIHVSLVNTDWVESTLTFATFPANGVGAPFRTVPFTGLEKVRFDVTAQVIDWMSGAKPNHGIALSAAGTPLELTNFRFGVGSSESTAKPYLSICWDASPCAGKTDGTACQDSDRCTVAGTCQAGLCQGAPAPAGTVCRAASSKCDVAETCDGATTKCPVAQIAPAGTVCRANAGSCDVPETCNGAAAECPTDQFIAAGTNCRSAAGVCDIAESCTGAAAACPADVKQPNGSACADDGNPCTSDRCDGAHDVCEHPAGNAGATCRAAVPGGCDAPETCTGSSTACPADVLRPAGTICRGSAGDCDVVETCSGSSTQCPKDTFLGAGSLCRQSTGACDVSDHCSGTSAACADTKEPDTQPCGTNHQCGSGSCNPCGTSFLACCQLETCTGTASQSLVCQNAGNPLAKCMQCGKHSQICCAGNLCDDPNDTCTDSGGNGFHCETPPK